MTVSITPAESLHIETLLPGDKSISHRAAMIAALAQGTSEIKNYATGQDCLTTIACLRRLGVAIEQDHHRILVKGGGLSGLQKPKSVLECGNSGTTARLLMGILAGQQFDAQLTGDTSLSRRPMNRMMDPLKLMGAEFQSTDDGTLPIEVHGRKLRAIDYTLPVPSAQVKSGLLFAGLFAKGTTSVRETIATRDHTERLLPGIQKALAQNEIVLSITGGREFRSRNFDIPADISSAAFLIIAALLAPNSEAVLRNVTLNPTRTAFLEVLAKMGLTVHVDGHSTEGVEPFGNLIVKSHNGAIHGVKLSGSIIPKIIDEIPILAILGTQTESGLEIRDAKELRYKECDRITALANNLRAMGAQVDEFDDGLFVHPSKLQGAAIESYHDHRIAMAFGVAGLMASGETIIHDAECVSISFPDFFNYLNQPSEQELV